MICFVRNRHPWPACLPPLSRLFRPPALPWRSLSQLADTERLLPEEAASQEAPRGAQLEVWTWGRGDSGQLGHGDEKNESVPRRIVAAALQEAEETSCETTSGDSHGKEWRGGVGASCGLFHSAFWAYGRLWLWGRGDGGRLGFGEEATVFAPRVNELLPAVKLAALGGLHSAAVTKEGELFTWGFGGFGALGLGDFVRQTRPQVVEGPWREERERIVDVATGGAHTAAVTQKGQVYTWGRDEGEHRLGHAQVYSAQFAENGAVPLPSIVPGIPPMVKAACGGFFTMALSTEGEVWTWGGNMNAELGRGPNKRFDWRPRHVTDLPTKIVRISAGGFHAAAVDEDGKLWTWGRGGNGQLGHDSLQTESVPRIVKDLEHVRIVGVTCGSTWTAAVSGDGTVFTWGKNTEGQVGQPWLPKMVPSPQPLELKEEGSLRTRKAVAIAGGVSHGVAIAIAEP